MTAATKIVRLATGLAGLTSIVVTAAAAAAEPAAGARASDDALAEVVVTGSRIRGVAPVGSPVISLDRSAIEESGASSTSERLCNCAPLPAMVDALPASTSMTALRVEITPSGS